VIRLLVRLGWPVAAVAFGWITYQLVAVVPGWPRWLTSLYGASIGLFLALSWVIYEDEVCRRRIAMFQKQHPNARIWGARRTCNLPAALARLDGTSPRPPRAFPTTYFVVVDRDGVSFIARPGQAPWRCFAWKELLGVETAVDPQPRTDYPSVALMVPVGDGPPATVDFTVYRTDGWSYLRTDQREVQRIAETLEGLRTAAANDRTPA